MTVSTTDYYRAGELAALVRSAVAALPPEARRQGRPPTRYVFCTKLQLEGPWGVIGLHEIVPRAHAAVRAHPEWFEDTAIDDGRDWAADRALAEELEERRRRIAELTRPPAPPRPSPPATKAPSYPWRVELRTEARRPYTIHLEGDTSRHIIREVRDVAPEGLETGGLLFGWSRAMACEASVSYISGAGAEGQLHGHSSMRLASEEAARAQMPDWLAADDLRKVGDWHYHPSAGSVWPSQADLDAWASILWRNERACMFQFPALIVSPYDAAGPRFTGWVTSPAGHATYVCEPAAVEGRYVR